MMEYVAGSSSLSSCLLCAPKFSLVEHRGFSSKGAMLKRPIGSCVSLNLYRTCSRKNAFTIRARAGGTDVRTSVLVVEEVEEDANLRRFQVFNGSPMPFGAPARDGGVNFAIYSGNAVTATLCMISLSDLQEGELLGILNCQFLFTNDKIFSCWYRELWL